MVSCHVLILSAAFSFAMAASPSTTTATTATSIPASALPSLVAELPACTAGCFPTVGIEIGCATTDLKCMCSQPSVFEAHMATCMSKNKCSKQEASGKNIEAATVSSKGQDYINLSKYNSGIGPRRKYLHRYDGKSRQCSYCFRV
ncbi:hypothetical protein GQ53DRAFT_746176 [Thozetella sp. PMI_491]|nr:hypothetical protein GQ53DRAFT_746176 [Thozetella sp. PMI_491]